MSIKSDKWMRRMAEQNGMALLLWRHAHHDDSVRSDHAAIAALDGTD